MCWHVYYISGVYMVDYVISQWCLCLPLLSQWCLCVALFIITVMLMCSIVYCLLSQWCLCIVLITITFVFMSSTVYYHSGVRVFHYYHIGVDVLLCLLSQWCWCVRLFIITVVLMCPIICYHNGVDVFDCLLSQWCVCVRLFIRMVFMCLFVCYHIGVFMRSLVYFLSDVSRNRHHSDVSLWNPGDDVLQTRRGWYDTSSTNRFTYVIM